MPGGIGPTGFVAFAAVDAGYSAAAWLLNRAYHSEHVKFKVGLARTGVGLAAGAFYGLGTLFVRFPEWLYFAGLIPIRVVEWGLFLRWFYEPRFLRSARSWRWTAVGIAWSFALDNARPKRCGGVNERR